MPEAMCVNHPTHPAVGKCSRCEQAFCLDCLDVETGRPLCKDCLANRPFKSDVKPPKPVSIPIPPPVKPQHPDTAISLDDLLMTPSKAAPDQAPVEPEPVTAEIAEPEPVLAEPQMPEPVAVPESMMAAPEPSAPKPEPVKPVELPVFKGLDNDPLGLFKNPPPVKMPVIDAPAKIEPTPPSQPEPTFKMEPPKPSVPEPMNPFAPAAASAPNLSVAMEEKPGFKPNFDLAGMMKKLDDAELAPKPEPIAPKPIVSYKDLHAPKPNPLKALKPFFSNLFLKIDLLAAKLKIPGFVLVGLVVAILAGGLTYFLQSEGGPVVLIVDSIPPIHILPIDVAGAGDIDVVAFNDLQQQLGNLGFTQAIQMTVPQLPGPNFFDVGLNTNTDTYCEILRMPSQIGCRVSFVTVFTNGVWYSTNGWSGTNQQLDYLVSEFYPDETPQQLFEQHKQGVQKLQAANSWDVQKVSLNRYIADLSDHLRWFLVTKKIAPYQADFASWH